MRNGGRFAPLSQTLSSWPPADPSARAMSGTQRLKRQAAAYEGTSWKQPFKKMIDFARFLVGLTGDLSIQQRRLVSSRGAESILATTPTLMSANLDPPMAKEQ